MTTPSVPTGMKKAAVLCILRSPAGLLLLQRTKEPHIGKYIPVGGKLEPFETPRNAALREIDEETGAKLSDVVLRGIMTETSPTTFNWINYIYSADILAFQPPPCDEGSLEWVPLNRLSSLSTPTTDRYIYERLAGAGSFIFGAEYDADLNLLLLTDEIARTQLYP